MKRIVNVAGILLLLLFLLRFPSEALAASRNGMNLWLNTLIPTLLPFMILTNVLIYTGAAEYLSDPLRIFWKKAFGISPSGACAFLLGLLCGYPMGAKTVSDLYSCKRINKQEAEYLLTFTNHASPVFVYTYMIHICLQDQVSPFLVFGILFMSSMITMLFFRFCIYGNHTITPDPDSKDRKKEPSPPGVSGTLLDASIMNGFETITRLGGYILLFSILSAFVKHYWKTETLAEYLFLGSLELTTGIHFLSGSDFPIPVKYLCVMPMAAFGGVCILAQTKSLLNKDLSFMPYISSKCLHAAVTAALSLIFIKVI